MDTLKAAKQDLRKRIRSRLEKMAEDEITSQSQSVTQAVLDLPEYQNASRVGIYLSMPSGELSTKHIVSHALSSGKTVYVPYLHNATIPDLAIGKSKMEMLSLHPKEDLDSLQRDKWGIPSLDPDSVKYRHNALGGYGVEWKQSEADKSKIDLILVPGMAFDIGRRRLGHGKGFYDRFLWEYKASLENNPDNPKMPVLAALALREQVLPPGEEVPVGEHDWLMNKIICAQEPELNVG